MSSIIIYYSYTGNTKKLAEEMATKTSADLYKVNDVKRPGTLNAYVLGSMKAMGNKNALIEPVNKDLNMYDKIILMCPIWAGRIAPQMNSVIHILPAGKEIELYAVSASGNSSGETAAAAAIEKVGCKLLKYTDLKS